MRLLFMVVPFLFSGVVLAGERVLVVLFGESVGEELLQAGRIKDPLEFGRLWRHTVKGGRVYWVKEERCVGVSVGRDGGEVVVISPLFEFAGSGLRARFGVELREGLLGSAAWIETSLLFFDEDKNTLATFKRRIHTAKRGKTTLCVEALRPHRARFCAAVLRLRVRPRAGPVTLHLHHVSCREAKVFSFLLTKTGQRCNSGVVATLTLKECRIGGVAGREAGIKVENRGMVALSGWVEGIVPAQCEQVAFTPWLAEPAVGRVTRERTAGELTLTPFGMAVGIGQKQAKVVVGSQPCRIWWERGEFHLRRPVHLAPSAEVEFKFAWFNVARREAFRRAWHAARLFKPEDRVSGFGISAPALTNHVRETAKVGLGVPRWVHTTIAQPEKMGATLRWGFRYGLAIGCDIAPFGVVVETRDISKAKEEVLKRLSDADAPEGLLAGSWEGPLLLNAGGGPRGTLIIAPFACWKDAVRKHILDRLGAVFDKADTLAGGISFVVLKGYMLSGLCFEHAREGNWPDGSGRGVLGMLEGSRAFGLELAAFIRRRGAQVVADLTAEGGCFLGGGLYDAALFACRPGFNWGEVPFLLRRFVAGQRPVSAELQAKPRRISPIKAAEQFAQTCLLYGFYPSCHLMLRDKSSREEVARMLARYQKLVDQLNAAGWQPVRGLLKAPEGIGVERFGEGSMVYLCVRSRLKSPQQVTLKFDIDDWHSAGLAPKVEELVSRRAVSSQFDGRVLTLRFRIKPKDTLLFKVVLE